jgi:hypothetical protein
MVKELEEQTAAVDADAAEEWSAVTVYVFVDSVSVT